VESLFRPEDVSEYEGSLYFLDLAQQSDLMQQKTAPGEIFFWN
jgi:hypothetical protein